MNRDVEERDLHKTGKGLARVEGRNERRGWSTVKEKGLSEGEMASVFVRCPGCLAVTRSLRKLTEYHAGFTCQRCPAAPLSKLWLVHSSTHSPYPPSFCRQNQREELPLFQPNKIQIWLPRLLTVWISF